MTSGTSSKVSRTDKVAAQRKAVAKAQSRRRNGIVLGAVAAVLIVAVGIGTLVQTQRNARASAGAVPANTGGPASSTIARGAAGAPVIVTLYEDFQCPICNEFEKQSGKTLESLVAKGTITLQYRPIAFLDRASTTKYSTRALNAAACVVNAEPTVYPAFHDLLYANQPAENSAGLPDSRLISLAQQAGAGDLSSCIKDQTYQGWTVRVTDQSSKDGVNGTPTVLVDGKAFSQPPTDAQLVAAITAAQANPKAR
jgi:protein-disulfide isomerase